MPRVIAKNRSEYGQSPLDLYTPVHFGVGFVAGILGISPVKAALVFLVAKIGVASAERGLGHALELTCARAGRQPPWCRHQIRRRLLQRRR